MTMMMMKMNLMMKKNKMEKMKNLPKPKTMNRRKNKNKKKPDKDTMFSLKNLVKTSNWESLRIQEIELNYLNLLDGSLLITQLS